MKTFSTLQVTFDSDIECDSGTRSISSFSSGSGEIGDEDSAVNDYQPPIMVDFAIYPKFQQMAASVGAHYQESLQRMQAFERSFEVAKYTNNYMEMGYVGVGRGSGSLTKKVEDTNQVLMRYLIDFSKVDAQKSKSLRKCLLHVFGLTELSFAEDNPLQKVPF